MIAHEVSCCIARSKIFYWFVHWKTSDVGGVCEEYFGHIISAQGVQLALGFRLRPKSGMGTQLGLLLVEMDGLWALGVPYFEKGARGHGLLFISFGLFLSAKKNESLKM